MKIPAHSGELIHTTHIEVKEKTGQDGHGQDIFEWKCLARTYCKIETLQGRNIEYSRQLYNLATLRVTMRFTPLVTTTCRLVIAPGTDCQRVFSVGHIDNLEQRNIWLVLLCSEGADK